MYEQKAYPGAAAETTLNGSITAGALTFTVAPGAGASYPDGSAGFFWVILDYDKSTAEKVKVTSRAGDVFTCSRGADSTTGQSHPDGAKVRAVWTATDAAEANTAVVNTVGKVTTLGDLLVGAGVNALKRLGVGTARRVVRANPAGTDVEFGDVADVQIFTANGTWTKPAGVKIVQIVCIGGGAGGGGGATVASGTSCSGGAGGGGGAAVIWQIPASALAATEAVAVGAGGSGGAAVSTASTNGNPGGVGGNTSFGTTVTIRSLGAPNAASPGTAGSNVSGFSGGQGMFTGASGTGSTNGGVGSSVPALNSFIATGGGGGGGVATTPAAFAGGSGGSQTGPLGGTGGAGGVGGIGGNGSSVPANAAIPGAGGGGGASNVAGNGFAGGNGGIYGSGGGGGGSCLNGSTSGAGGNGGAGICVVTSW